MPGSVHHNVHARDEEEPILGIERPGPNTGGFTEPSEFAPERILMGVHVRHPAHVHKQRIPVLHAKQHAVDRQA